MSKMTLPMKTAIVWGAVILMYVITAAIPSLTERYINNITTDGLTLLYVSGIVFIISIAAYLVRNYSKRVAVKNEQGNSEPNYYCYQSLTIKIFTSFCSVAPRLILYNILGGYQWLFLFLDRLSP
jgi:hypothetical protein